MAQHALLLRLRGAQTGSKVAPRRLQGTPSRSHSPAPSAIPAPLPPCLGLTPRPLSLAAWQPSTRSRSSGSSGTGWRRRRRARRWHGSWSAHTTGMARPASSCVDGDQPEQNERLEDADSTPAPSRQHLRKCRRRPLLPPARRHPCLHACFPPALGLTPTHNTQHTRSAPLPSSTCCRNGPRSPPRCRQQPTTSSSPPAPPPSAAW